MTNVEQVLRVDEQAYLAEGDLYKNTEMQIGPRSGPVGVVVECLGAVLAGFEPDTALAMLLPHADQARGVLRLEGDLAPSDAGRIGIA